MRGYTGCWLASAAFAMDRVTKWLALSNLKGSGPVDALPGVLRLVYVENKGAAFGLFQQHALLLLFLTAAALIGLITFLVVKKNKIPTPARLSLWLLAGGAAGNFFDRLFLGYVVDFLEIRFFSFPVFNIADCCVSVSAVLLMGFILFYKETRHDAG